MTGGILTALIWFSITLIAIATVIAVGGWVLIPIGLEVVLAFIAGKMSEGW